MDGPTVTGADRRSEHVIPLLTG